MKKTGVGKYVPKRVVTNDEIAAMMRERRGVVAREYGLDLNDPSLEQFDTSDEWLFSRTGAKERRWAPPGMATSDLAYEAACAALEASGLGRDYIGFIVLATVTPDHHASPCTAALVAERLGIRVRNEAGEIIRDVEAFDVTKACSSFAVALSIGDAFIRCGTYKAGLVIGADVMTRIVNPDDRSPSTFMGDGAGCVVLERCVASEDQFAPEYFLGGTDGSLAHLIEIPAGGSRTRLSPEMLTNPFNRGDTLRMDGPRVSHEVTPLLIPLIERALKKAGVKPEDLCCVLLHQANGRMNAFALRRTPYAALSYSTFARYGNTTSASLPLGLADAEAEGKLVPGKFVLMVAFGGGIGWNTVLMRIPK